MSGPERCDGCQRRRVVHAAGDGRQLCRDCYLDVAETLPDEVPAPAANGSRRDTTPSVAEPVGVADELGALLGLPAVGRSIVGARIAGRGIGASGEVELDGGQVIEFDSLRDFGTPDWLRLTFAAETGAEPSKLSKDRAVHAVVLLRAIAERLAGLEVRALAEQQGSAFLQAASEHPFDVTDQASRWHALNELSQLDPITDAQFDRVAFASRCVVLLDASGARYVRSVWFHAHVRGYGEPIGPQRVTQRMRLAGWRHVGKVHAREPDGPGQLLFPFYVVPADWPDAEPRAHGREGSEPLVAGGSRSNAHTSDAQSCARKSGPAATSAPFPLDEDEQIVGQTDLYDALAAAGDDAEPAATSRRDALRAEHRGADA